MKFIILFILSTILFFGCTTSNETLPAFHLQSKLDQIPIECRANIYNCDDFATQEEAQLMLKKCGEDVHKLDRDKDGRACE